MIERGSNCNSYDRLSFYIRNNHLTDFLRSRSDRFEPWHMSHAWICASTLHTVLIICALQQTEQWEILAKSWDSAHKFIPATFDIYRNSIASYLACILVNRDCDSATSWATCPKCLDYSPDKLCLFFYRVVSTSSLFHSCFWLKFNIYVRKSAWSIIQCPVVWDTIFCLPDSNYQLIRGVAMIDFHVSKSQPI